MDGIEYANGNGNGNGNGGGNVSGNGNGTGNGRNHRLLEGVIENSPMFRDASVAERTEIVPPKKRCPMP